MAGALVLGSCRRFCATGDAVSLRVDGRAGRGDVPVAPPLCTSAVVSPCRKAAVLWLAWRVPPLKWKVLVPTVLEEPSPLVTWPTLSVPPASV